MADKYTLADFLQRPELAAAGNFTPPFGGAMPQSEAEREALSWRQALPYMAWLPPVGAYLGGQRIGQAWQEGDPVGGALGVAEVGLSASPLALMRTAGRTPRPAPPPPTGPWQPGYMQQWLEGRYQPAASPQAWQADRRWGSPGNDAPLTWGDVVAGRFNRMDFDRPLDPRQWREIMKGAVAAGTAGGLGGGTGQYLTDRYWHGRPASEAAWRAMTAGPYSDPPPDWWPQPQSREGEGAIPISGPQPPSMLRSGW
jgi:hypothetical protein